MSKNKNRYTQKPATVEQNAPVVEPELKEPVVEKIKPGTIKSITVSGSIYNIVTQDAAINEMVDAGWDFIEATVLSAMDMVLRFRKL